MHAARDNRKDPTPAEEAFWKAVRYHGVGGYQFRRQHPVGPFILDFYCAKRKLAVEIDGAIHELQAEHDQARTEALATLKIQVIRFRNEELLQDLPGVLDRLAEALKSRYAD